MSASAEDHTAPSGSTRSRLLLLSLLLAMLTAAVYWPVSGHDFVNFDDNFYITENPWVKGGLTRENVSWAFSRPYLSNWHPLTWISHMADVEIFGLDAGRHHLVNVALHIVNSVLLLLLLTGMTGTLWPSALVGALFALHPMHVESVAWVSARKDVLSTFFWMTTLLFYLSYGRRPSALRYLAALACFSLGLMSKPMLVTLPFTLLLLDYWPLDRGARHGKAQGADGPGGGYGRLLVEKIPFFLLSGASSAVTLLSQSRGGAVKSLEAFPLPERVANAILAYVTYIYKAVLPIRLSVFYPHRGGDVAGWQVAAALILLASITAAFLLKCGRHRYLPVGWLWYLITLLPVIGLVQVGDQALADRYTYVPFVGLFVILAWGSRDLCGRSRRRIVTTTLLSAAALAGLSILAFRQVNTWRDSGTLFTHALAATGVNALAHERLGSYYGSKGKNPEAERHLREALRLSPSNPAVKLSLAHLLMNRGSYAEAARLYAQYLEHDRSNWIARRNLGWILIQREDLDSAIYQLEEALRLMPDFGDAHFLLGLALHKRGDLQEALVHYYESLRNNPNQAMVHNNIATILSRLGKGEEAERHLESALGIDPLNFDSLYNMGLILEGQGRGSEAIGFYRRALASSPGDGEVRRRLEMLEPGSQPPSSSTTK